MSIHEEGDQRAPDSPMRRQKDEADIRAAIRAEMQDYFNNAPFVVNMEKHFLHHQQMDICYDERQERRDNHKFVSHMREDISTFQRSMIKRIATWVLLFMAGSVSFSWIAKQLGWTFK